MQTRREGLSRVQRSRFSAQAAWSMLAQVQQRRAGGSLSSPTVSPFGDPSCLTPRGKGGPASGEESTRVVVAPLSSNSSPHAGPDTSAAAAVLPQDPVRALPPTPHPQASPAQGSAPRGHIVPLTNRPLPDLKPGSTPLLDLPARPQLLRCGQARGALGRHASADLDTLPKACIQAARRLLQAPRCQQRGTAGLPQVSQAATGTGGQHRPAQGMGWSTPLPSSVGMPQSSMGSPGMPFMNMGIPSLPGLGWESPGVHADTLEWSTEVASLSRDSLGIADTSLEIPGFLESQSLARPSLHGQSFGMASLKMETPSLLDQSLGIPSLFAGWPEDMAACSAALYNSAGAGACAWTWSGVVKCFGQGLGCPCPALWSEEMNGSH